MLPKILHLYWGKNQPLSFLRSLTVATFRRLNPYWRVSVWVPKSSSAAMPWESGEQPLFYEGKDYLTELEDLTMEVDFPALGIPEDFPEVHKADLLRWHLLGRYGGVWSDFDTIFIQPIPAMAPYQWRGAGLCRYEAIPGDHRLFQAIGFLSSQGSLGQRFFEDLFRFGLLKGPQADYQAFGANLLEEFLDQHWQEQETPFYHDGRIVYHYRFWGEVTQYFRQAPLNYDRSRTIGLHWYGGNPENAKLSAEITPENIGRLKWPLCREAVAVLS